MKKRQKTAKKRIPKLALLVLIVPFLLLLFGGSTNVFSLWGLKRQNDSYAQQYQQAQKQIDSLKIVIEKLQSDTAYIEKIAREQLGMARSDERVITFIEDTDED